jgi:peroxiredoxin
MGTSKNNTERALHALTALGATLALGLALLSFTLINAGATPGGRAARLGSVSHLTYSDLTGKEYGPASLAAHKATVFLFVSGQCPISNVYTPRFRSLAHDYAARGVQVFAVYSDRQESRADVAAHAKTHGITFPIIKDERNALADRLGATYTPQAVVVDAEGAIRYRGRIDDNAVVTRVTTHDLIDALDAVLTGKPIAHPEVAAFGCAIRRVDASTVVLAGIPTYAHDVAPILRAKCESCHRSGEVAPFTLQDYKQASAWATDIKRYTQNGQMPPWKPASGYGEFANEHEIALTDQERTTLAKWADGGAPLGNPKQIPPPRQFPTDWKMGEPDRVLAPEKEFHLAADGEDVYRNFVVKADFDHDLWVRAVEVHPGNRAVVHHVINYVDVSGVADKLEAETHDGQPGYTSFGSPGFTPRTMLSGWAPGNEPLPLQDGVALKVPKGSRIVIQVHYHKDGKPETDKTQIGLYFAKTTVDKELGYRMAINFGFHIPPGADNYEVNARAQVNTDSHLYGVLPHMHLLGKDMKVWAKLPGHTEVTPLIWIKNWDFNWQATYPLKTPLALPAGTVVFMTAHFDNSASNLRNPNRLHPHEVTWGESTTDEMCLCFLTTTVDAQHLAAQPSAAPIRTAANTTR